MSVVKLLSNNMNNGILPLDDDTLVILEQKHQEIKDALDDVLLDRPLVRINEVNVDKECSTSLEIRTLVYAQLVLEKYYGE